MDQEVKPDLTQPSFRLPFTMLTDEEAAEIRRKLDEGWRGPALITWLYRLLEDREERVRMSRDLSQEKATVTKSG